VISLSAYTLYQKIYVFFIIFLTRLERAIISHNICLLSRRSAGGIMDLSELDPVEELPAEHLEDSP